MIRITSALRTFSYKFSFSSIKFASVITFNMEKAYLRHSPNGEYFDLTFKLPVNENSSRAFNFSRKLNETVETFLSRVKTNVEKVVNKKKKKTPVSDLQPVSATLLINKSPVAENQTCQEIFKQGESIELIINNKTFSVIINSPWVITLELPTSILATFPTYPSKFETLFTNLNLSEFVWFKSKDNVHWDEVGRNYIYVPRNEDMECFLKFSCTPKNEYTIGPTIEAVSTCKVEASPGECPFERRQIFTQNRVTGNEFRIVSYNILANLYCDSDYTREVLFPYCPPYALSIDYRKQLFMKEIIGYNADLICLQEVDSRIYKCDLESTMSHLGYKSTFYTKGTEVTEGQAFFYNEVRFILLDTQKVIFSQEIASNPVLAEIWERVKKNEKLAERILARSTILQVNVVGSLEFNEVLVIANTHLYFHPDADHIRLLHGSIAIKYLEDVVRQLQERYEGKRVSLIFCGDFNSVPTCGIYQLYTTGSIPGNFVDYSSNPEESIENINMTHSFQLGSACGTPEYTNFTASFADCLDYIYYDKSSLTVSQVVPMPSKEELTQHTAIPSIVFPSDHIALVSDLKWS
ncbi:2',5'-phosphodiesterase 12 [Euwallacea fornicatus]|uniref:2',5'-phosphodiesterase 12 n=1 Tax=Euwallacea fornicatus TaxID=995702 RepID=UPI00338E5EDB